MYTTTDLTADGHADLVVTHDDCDDRRRLAPGRPPWSSSGFARSPSSFAVPAPRCQVDFDYLGGVGGVTYTTVDLTALDGRPDLVVTHDNCDTTVGVSHWDVYPWSSSGFAPSPSSFAVPAPRCQADFDSVSGAGEITFATANLKDACAVSLVVAHDDCDTTVGQTHWDVYAQP